MTDIKQWQKNTKPENTKPEDIVKKIPTLEFKSSGWCEELKISYRRGKRTPKTIKEYNALKKYALNNDDK